MTDAVQRDRDRAEDVRAIRDVVADIETGFNTNDAELCVRHFTDDGWSVGVTGVRVAGRPELLAAHRAGLAGPLREQHARYRVGEVSFPRPDVAIAQKYATAVDPAGRPLGVGHAMIALYVLVKDDGRWRVAARQNTLAPG
jgi:uncharacterized protein (TIGR02246 family)